MKPIIVLLLILGAQIGRAQDSLQTNIPVHDPVMIRQDGVYYVFATGRGIIMWSSKDMHNWKKEKPVFNAPPEWAIKAVPGFKGHIWAPDISFHKGLYYLYYSISTFGKNRSCIDLATNKTLNPASTDYNDYFYLFASYDYCCRGEKSTYKMRVGRSRALTGPYLDKNGVPMTQGGGTLVLEGNADWHGVGHNAVCTFDGVDYLVFHGYDARDKGRSKLRVERLDWQDKWPVLRSH